MTNTPECPGPAPDSLLSRTPYSIVPVTVSSLGTRTVATSAGVPPGVGPGPGSQEFSKRGVSGPGPACQRGAAPRGRPLPTERQGPANRGKGQRKHFAGRSHVPMRGLAAGRRLGFSGKHTGAQFVPARNRFESYQMGLYLLAAGEAPRFSQPLEGPP